MDDVLHVDAIDDETVRVELNGETHEIDAETARQLTRDLDVAIDELGNGEENPEPKTDEGYVELLQNARHVETGTAERIAQEFESVEELAKADDDEIEALKNVGPTARLHIQEEVL